jgi:ribonuclease III
MLPLEELEDSLGYQFRNRELLLRALTHRSWLPEQPSSSASDNEQLEFLGDSILGFLVSEALVIRHPFVREGELSQWKAHLVSSTYLHGCAVTLNLGDFLMLGKGEERNGGRQRRTLLANAFEAVIAAIYLDGGIDPVRTFIERTVLRSLEEAESMKLLSALNFKSVLQEQAQALGLPLPRYSIVETDGPEHAKTFLVEARIDKELFSRARGSSKKIASQQAAQQLIRALQVRYNSSVHASGPESETLH